MCLFLYIVYIKTVKLNHKHMNNETPSDENSARSFTLCQEQGKCIHDTKTDSCVLAFDRKTHMYVYFIQTSGSKFALNEKL